MGGAFADYESGGSYFDENYFNEESDQMFLLMDIGGGFGTALLWQFMARNGSSIAIADFEWDSSF